MSKIRFVAMSAMMLVTVCAARAQALDVSATKIQIKDHADPAKRQIQVQSVDTAILFADTDDPSANKASVHVYSTTDDFCVKLPATSNWTTNGKQWKYKDANKNQALVKDKKLIVKIRSGVDYSLNEVSQTDVNVQVQFGTGTRYCMRCNGAEVIQNDNKKYFGKQCAAVACDAEADPCDPTATTTTTTPGPPIVVGALPPTPGRFNYNLTLGLPGAAAACNTNYAGSHVCSYPELVAGETNGDLVGLQDINSNNVNSFWAVDNTQPALQQCQDDAPGGSFLNWEYGTAHTASRGQRVTLANATGILGALQSNVQCNIAGNSWVGCCQ